jgi:hypothetical protein
MIKDALTLFAKSTGLFLLEIPVTLFGLIAVAVGIPFRRTFPETTKQFKDPRYAANGSWRLVRMPKWLLWYDNINDGLTGDKRGWYDNYCKERFGKPGESFIGMYWWAAIRNPNNYFNRYVTGVDVSRCTFEKLAGNTDDWDEDKDCYIFIKATDKYNGKKYYQFAFTKKWWFNKNKAIIGRFGWKIELHHQNISEDAPETERFKGNVYRITPWKTSI